MNTNHIELNAEKIADELRCEIEAFINAINHPKYARILEIKNLLITDEEYATDFVLQTNDSRIKKCPNCEAIETVSLKPRPNKIKDGFYCRCSKCGHQFSPWTGTPLMATKKELTRWMQKIFQIVDPINGNEPPAAPRTIKRMEDVLSRSGISVEILEKSAPKRLSHWSYQELFNAAWKVKELATAIEFYQITKSFIENKSVTHLSNKCPK